MFLVIDDSRIVNLDDVSLITRSEQEIDFWYSGLEDSALVLQCNDEESAKQTIGFIAKKIAKGGTIAELFD